MRSTILWLVGATALCALYTFVWHEPVLAFIHTVAACCFAFALGIDVADRAWRT